MSAANAGRPRRTDSRINSDFETRSSAAARSSAIAIERGT